MWSGSADLTVLTSPTIEREFSFLDVDDGQSASRKKTKESVPPCSPKEREREREREEKEEKEKKKG